jgi:hypothetical protein
MECFSAYAFVYFAAAALLHLSRQQAFFQAITFHGYGAFSQRPSTLSTSVSLTTKLVFSRMFGRKLRSQFSGECSPGKAGTITAMLKLQRKCPSCHRLGTTAQ